MRNTVKGIRFEKIISRADSALKEGYYIESIAIYYAFMEERLETQLGRMGYVLNKKQKMAYCIDFIKKDSSLIGYFDATLLSNLDKWRSDRNNLIHDYAKDEMDYESFEPVAKEGKKLSRELSSAIMRYKKKAG